MSLPRGLLWLFAATLVALPCALAPRPSARALGLIGPVAELAAEVQWVRYEGALTRGEEAHALALAESALALAPRVSAGWQHLAAHLGYDLASRTVEPDPARRRVWLAAAESTLTRGAAAAARPAELLLFHALLLASKADVDPELAPGGKAELLARSRALFEQAAELGSHEAREVLGSHRAREVLGYPEADR